MMKKVISIFSLSLVLFACKKESVNVPAPKSSPFGFWVGMYGFSNATPSQGYFMLLRENGTLRVFSGTDTATAAKAEGTYTMMDGNLKAKYTYLNSGVTYSIATTLSADNKKQNGTWGSEFNSTDGGTFYLNKQ